MNRGPNNRMFTFSDPLNPLNLLILIDLGAFWVVSGRAFGWYFPYDGSEKSRGVLFLEKKVPCQECPGCRRNWFSHKIQNSKNSDKKNTIFREGTRGKMTPQVFSIQWQSLFLIHSRS